VYPPTTARFGPLAAHAMPAAGCGGKFWTATRSQLIVDVESACTSL
jgi:hypothetical protein